MAKEYTATGLILGIMRELEGLEALYIHNTRGEIVAVIFPRETLDQLELPDKFMDHDHIEPGQF